ncbi:type VII secretion protein EccB [Catenuloplanes nepalensis]|uniref:Type VII secretion protein EccB n=1 Tax=Catenuloplanes nepalensis TaxID=587533 RepID=A0ABT9N1M3_9ACTN|nr:type VII secretion protein EccB [Catenuloplanes nepalensis]MDP9797590.1 type VII secretion protein EccB [Catenuloplanes nepalensis]
MRTRRDQVQAYRFVTRRIVSAVVSGEPETNELPMRRLGLALFGSVLVGALVLGVFGAYGLLTENKAPLANDTLVIDKDSGATYVYTSNKLFPVANYASARLILATDAPEIRRVSAGSLRDKPRARTVGIMNAPDALPDPKNLSGSTWRVCSNLTALEGDAPISSLVVGRSLSGAATLAGDEGLLVHVGEVQNNTAVFYLVWNNTRLAVPRPALVGLDPTDSIKVAEELVNAIPAGPNLAPVELPGQGSPAEEPVDGRSAAVGTVFRVGDRFYVLAESGLAPVGNLMAQLFQDNGAEVRDTTAQEADRRQATTRVEPDGFPSEMPRLSQTVTNRSNSAICDFYDVGDNRNTVEVYATRPAELAAALDDGTDSATRAATATVDRVLVTGGTGALIQPALPGGTAAPGSTVFLLTDEGRMFALGTAGGDAKTALGYGGSSPSPVPASLIDLIPAGPTLDIELARRTVTSAATTG